MNNVIIVFKDGELKLEVNVRDNRESIWLHHQQIAELFDCDVKTINKHISNVLKEKLNEQVVVAKFESTTKHGAIERILKTKEKLQSALRILLETKDVSDITVSSLCEVADINRSTFYVYYSNIQDCFEEITDSIMDEMRTLLQNNLNPSQEGFLLVYFRTARKYKNVFLAIHRQGVHNSTIQKMVDINNDWLHGELFIPTSSNRLEYNFIFSGFYGMVEMWLQNGCKESDEQLINILKKFYVVNR